MKSPNPPAQTRVLVVDDSAGDIFLLREMVEEDGKSRFRVTAEAGNLETALKVLAERQIDVVLLDLQLPDSHGVETFSRAHTAAPDVPIIVLSESDDEELALQTVQLGAHEYLVKGRVDAHLLQRALRYAVERARAEAQLASERDLLQTLLENIPDRIYFKDRESRFIRINRALTTLFGLKSAEEAYGKTDADFYGPEHAGEALYDERRLMESGQPLLGKVEYENLADGRRSWSLTTKLPLRDRQGRIIGTCGISREISEMKEMEEQLETERNLLRAVIDNLPDLVFLKDVEGHYLLNNMAHIRWLGASDPSEVRGRTVFDYFPDKVAAEFHQGDMKVAEARQPLLNQEEHMVDAHGNHSWRLTSKIPWLDDSGKTVGLVCISRDVTEQKQAEERLKKANTELAANREELLRAVGNLQQAHGELRDVQLQLIEAEKMKSIGRLAAGVAHEVKNPLAILKMGLEFLSTQKFTDEHTPEILREMGDALGRADKVIRGLLDFSAPKQLEVKRENLNAIIDNALQLVRGEMKSGIGIERDLQPNLPPLKVDAGKISQVFVNLFTNALHAMEDGGLLAVRTYSKQLTGVGANISDSRSESFRVGQQIVVAEIDDTGHGIPEDKLAKIFEPFFTTKPTGRGTGLGLSVVRTIIDLHGATIDIRNLHEAGVRVTLMFQS
ncbi:MAG: PAS domain-containing protein [Chthoniobacter sp.]|nr:PAS domain-containing protein [Chthoniobacter sp.]